MQSSDFSLHGAIDLGARQAAARKKEQRRAAGGGSQYVVDVTYETFNVEVVERSRTVPVIVDFWAEWCQPCKQLSPVLEKLAGEDAGRWVLAKVDIDANPQLASYMQQMGVRGIPFVAVVVAGQLMPFLQGAAPEQQVRQAVDQLFEALRQQGIMPEAPEGAAEAGAAEQPPVDPVYAEAEEALRGNDLDAAAAAFKKILDTNPQDSHAKRGLALVELSRRVRGYDHEQARRNAAERPGDVEAQTQVADLDMLSDRVEEAFDRLIGTVRRVAGEDRDKARLHLIGLFDVLDPEDPRLARARRALSAALF